MVDSRDVSSLPSLRPPQSHSPSHFFLKIRVPRGTPARLAPSLRQRFANESLLPILYKELEEPPGAASTWSTLSSVAALERNACPVSTFPTHLGQARAKFGSWRKKFKDDIEMNRLAIQDAARARTLVPLDALIHP